MQNNEQVAALQGVDPTLDVGQTIALNDQHGH